MKAEMPIEMLEQPEIIYLKNLSDEDATFFGQWMAKAFYRRDPWTYIHCGVSYADDPDLHELYFKASMLRASICGEIMTTPDRKTACQLYRPGVSVLTANFDYRSGCDDAWDQWTAKAGGREAIEARRKMMFELGKQEDALYGIDDILHYRYGAFAIHSDLQGQGIGRYLHRYNMKRAETESRLLVWGSCRVNYGFYEKCGSKRVGHEVMNLETADVPADYDPGCQFSSVMQN